MPEYDKAKGTANFLQVYFVGISMVMASHCALWQIGLFEGFWEYFISIMIVSIAFLALCLCLSEMISILPFGGGAYGFARVTMGPFLGFMVGFFDSIANIIYVSLFIRVFVLIFTFCTYIQYDPKDLPYMWFLVYVGLVLVHVGMGKYNFWFIALMGLVVLAVPIIFIAGTAKDLDYQLWVVDEQKKYLHVWMPLGTRGFIRFLPVSAVFYFGIDMMCLVCEDTKNATTTVPRAMMAVFITMFVLAIGLLFAVCSQSPGAVISAYVPFMLTFGFAEIFKTTSFQRITITLIPCFAMEIYTLTYAFSRQMCALSRSTLLPPMFSWTSWGNVPYMSIIVGSILGMLNLVVLDYIDEDQFENRISLMYTVGQLCSITVYVISMLSFIVFRVKYSILNRPFNVGIVGIPLAIIGICIFIVLAYSLCFLSIENHFHLKAYAILCSFGIVYYFAYARWYQSFSQEEQSILFAVYVIKANSKHRTVYRWLEKKYQRYVLKNVSSTSLAIRTSLRKTTGRTKTKITPQSADSRKARAAAAAAAAAEEKKSVGLGLEPISHMSQIHNNVSGSSNNVTSADGKTSSNATREQDIEMVGPQTPYAAVPLGGVRLAPLSHVPHYEMLPDKNELDADLDRPFDAGIRQKMGFQTKSDIVVEGIVSSGIVESDSHE